MFKIFFTSLSKNEFLNNVATKYGWKLGAQNIVAGTTIEETTDTIQKLNAQGISCTIDNLGEFVNKKEKAIEAKEQIMQVIEMIEKKKLDAHISLKPSQLGLDIDEVFCFENLKEIVGKAHSYDIFVNFDMEDYPRLQPSFDMIDELSKDYDNIGTVIQAYFFRAKEDIKKYKNYRMRLVKGAYKEPANVSYQTKKEIDKNYIDIIEYHLLNGYFTSIATHDHHVINHVKNFVKVNEISKDQFEFQMLYGFRKDLQFQLVREGYNFCTYVPFGQDWYGYFMRRLAERPQNINLIVKQVFNKKVNTALAVTLVAFFLGRLSKRK